MFSIIRIAYVKELAVSPATEVNIDGAIVSEGWTQPLCGVNFLGHMGTVARVGSHCKARVGVTVFPPMPSASSKDVTIERRAIQSKVEVKEYAAQTATLPRLTYCETVYPTYSRHG